MKAVCKILNNQYKVTMKHFYNIICDTDLGKGFCDMRPTPCACNGCVEQPSNHWLPNRDKPYNHVILPNPKHVSNIPSYVATINGIFDKLT